MKNLRVREAIKKQAAKSVSTKYCQSHCIDGIEHNGRVVCGFCRAVPGKIVHYQIEQVGNEDKTVFYKLCPTCGDIVRVVKAYENGSLGNTP